MTMTLSRQNGQSRSQHRRQLQHHPQQLRSQHRRRQHPRLRLWRDSRPSCSQHRRRLRRPHRRPHRRQYQPRLRRQHRSHPRLRHQYRRQRRQYCQRRLRRPQRPRPQRYQGWTRATRVSHACTPTAATHTSTHHCATPRWWSPPQVSTQDPATSIRPQATTAPVTTTPTIPVQPLARRRLQARRSIGLSCHATPRPPRRHHRLRHGLY